MRVSVIFAYLTTLVSLTGVSTRNVKEPADAVKENNFLNRLNEEQRDRLLQETRPLVEAIAQAFDFQRLEVFMLTARFNDLLTGNGPHAFFPPGDTAWDNVAPGLIAKFRDTGRQWRGHLRNLLEYHLYVGDLGPEATQTITMVNGEDVDVTVSGNSVSANGVAATSTIPAADGNAYVLGKILEPAWMGRNLWNLVSTAHPTLASLIVTAGLDRTVGNPDAALTLFAPSERAFEAMTPAALDYLKSLEGLSILQETLRYHIVDGVYPKMNLPSSGSVNLATLSGDSITVNVDGNLIMVHGVTNSAAVRSSELFATNGVAHVISTMLLTAPLPDSIVEIVTDRPDLSSLASAILAADIADTLDEAGPLLFFAPTDSALSNMDSVLASFLFNDSGWILHLQDFLLFHATNQVMTSDTFNDDEVFTMLNGEEVEVPKNAQGLSTFSPSFGFPCRLGDVRDLQGINGFVTTITRPLAPSWASAGLYNILNTQDNTSTLARLLEMSELALPALVKDANCMVSPTKYRFKVVWFGCLFLTHCSRT